MKRKVKKAVFALVFLLCLWPLGASAADIPDLNDCHMISLRMSDGWWLQVHSGNTAEYGFGTMIDRIRIKPGSLNFAQVFETAKKNLLEQRRDAEAPYVAAAFYKTGENGAREYYLEHQEWAGEVFRTARDNSLEPENEMEKRWREKIDEFWEKSPPRQP